MRHDARLAFKQPAADFPGIKTDLLRVPGDAEGWERTASRRFAHLRGYARNARDLFGNVAVPPIPLAEVGLYIALGTPYLYRAKHPDNFLLAGLFDRLDDLRQSSRAAVDCIRGGTVDK